jgi:hypothetical protein
MTGGTGLRVMDERDSCLNSASQADLDFPS